MTDVIILLINLCVAGIVGALSAFFTIGKYKEKVDSLEKEVGTLRTKHDNLKSDVDKLLEFKLNAQKFIDSKIYKSKSPLSLTEYGEMLVKESGFNEIFPSVQADLVRMLEKKGPKTKYDVQEMARALMDELTDYSAFQPMKAYAFKTGNDYQQILRAGALLLRDHYLTAHPEITA